MSGGKSNTVDPAMEEVEVNGKIDLGTRRLVVSYVENACSFYAYTEKESKDMEDIKTVVTAECVGLPRLTIEDVKLEQMYGVYYADHKLCYRGRVEQVNQGQDKKQARVRMVDFGWNDLVAVTDMCHLPSDLADMKISCVKYKMADLKPKGRADGYTAADRQKGQEWLEKTIGDKIIIANCHKLVKYAGGVMADCMLDNVNLNQAALKKGHVIAKPSGGGASAGRRGGRGGGGYNHNQQGRGYNQYNHQNTFPPNYNMDRGIMHNGGVVDMDYAAYNGMGFGGPIGGYRSQGSSDKEVKKLEKKLEEGNKTISQLKKTTNLDSAVKGMVSLIDQVSEARRQSPEKAGMGNKTLASLVGVAETVEEAVDVSAPMLLGVEAVEAAAKRVGEGERMGVKKGEVDAHRVALLQARTDLHKCITKYLSEYRDGEVAVNDVLCRVESQLAGMKASIPASWKLLAVRSDKVGREELLEVAAVVREWLETAGSRETVMAATSKKEMDNLARSLNQLADGLRDRLSNSDAEVPANIDSVLSSAKAALTAELSGLTGKVKPQRPKKGQETKQDDSTVVRDSWKSLTLLKNQLSLVKKKNDEYRNMLAALEPQIASA